MRQLVYNDWRCFFLRQLTFFFNKTLDFGCLLPPVVPSGFDLVPKFFCFFVSECNNMI